MKSKRVGETISVGTVLLLSVGEYSDYDIVTICRCQREFNTLAVEQEYREVYPMDDSDYQARNDDHTRFVNWLVNEEHYCEEVNHREIHMGYYDRVLLS